MMSYGFLLNSVPIDCKNLLRKIETEEKRMIRIRSLQQFTKNCLDNTILPKYVNLFISYMLEMGKSLLRGSSYIAVDPAAQLTAIYEVSLYLIFK